MILHTSFNSYCRIITSLFNLFCPVVLINSLVKSLLLIIGFTFLFSLLLLFCLISSYEVSVTPFRVRVYSGLLGVLFLLLCILNLLSIRCFSYPVTTTLRFNLRLALRLWRVSVLISLVKCVRLSVLIPLNRPWYLVPFLALVEMISIAVRPITLCVRLLANLRAGHILLTLICKLSYITWVIGSLFALLELLVSIVQAYVFVILCRVYIEESFRH